MPSEPETLSDIEDQLGDVLLSYLQAVEAGQAPTLEEVVARHPHVAAELRTFFADQEFLKPLVAPLVTPPLAAPLPEAFPQPFGDYELLGRIAIGGMGVVYKARQTCPPHRRFVALKMIRDRELASPEDVQRFRREAENVANLEHPNIVPIYEVGEHEGRVFFSMMLAEGGSLADSLTFFAGRPRATARLLAVVALAVHHAHQRRILHRDLKPANILLASPLFPGANGKGAAAGGNEAPAAPAKKGAKKMDARGEVEGIHPFVTDFGLACGIDDATRSARLGLIEGTVGYMAPEQATGEKGVTTAADVYGLGAVLYEVLTGQPPFRGKDIVDTLLMVREKEPAAPRRIRPGADRDLEAVCLKCLRKDPARRYGSAKELADDLQRYLDYQPIKGRPVGRLERASLWARRRPGVAALTAAVVVVALLGLGGVLWNWRDAVAAYDKQEAVLYVNRIHLAQKHLEDGQFYLAEEQLGLCPERRRAWEWYYLNRQCRRPVELGGREGHEGRVLAVQYSLDDGATLATGGQDGTVRIWDPATGNLLHTLGDHPGGVTALCFGECGGRSLLVSACEDQTVRVWDAATGKKLQDLPGAGCAVAGSRDGRRFAAVGQASVVTVWDADGPGLLGASTLGMLASSFGQGPLLAASALIDEPFRQVYREDLGSKAAPTGIALSSDGRRLAVCGYGGLVKVWNASAHWAPLPLPTEASVGLAPVWAVAFSADGAFLAVGGPQPVVWKVDDPGRPPLPFSEPGDQRCNALAFSPNGQLLAGIYRDGLVRVWDTSRGTIVRTPFKDDGHDLAAAFSPDGSHLALTWGDKATVEVIDPKPPAGVRPKSPAGSRVLANRGPTDVWAVAFSRDGRLAFRAGDEVVLADASAGALRPSVNVGAHVADGANLVFGGNDGRLLFSGRAGAPLWVWDADAEANAALTIPAADVRCCAVSGDDRYLATTRGDNGIDVWDLRLPGDAHQRSFHGGGDIKALAFRPDRPQLASCGADGKVHLWEALTGQEIRAFPGNSKAVTAVAFSKDSTRMAAAGSDLTVHVWDPDDGRQECFSLKGHLGCVTGLAFSPDGRRLASCATDGMVKLWDAESGQEVLTLTGHDGPVWGVAFSPDGRRLATCSRDGTVRIWDGGPREE